MHHYQQSADFFRGEESNSSANKCMLKVKEKPLQNQTSIIENTMESKK